MFTILVELIKIKSPKKEIFVLFIYIFLNQMSKHINTQSRLFIIRTWPSTAGIVKAAFFIHMGKTLSSYLHNYYDTGLMPEALRCLLADCQGT